MPPYEMAQELRLEDQILSPNVPQFQFFGTQQIPKRLWFTNPENPEFLIQVQSDYLALNWRRQDDSHRYPGFEQLSSEFDRYLRLVSDACEGQGGSRLKATRSEITYINLLKPDGIWGSFRELENVITLGLPRSGEVEQLNAAYSRSIDGMDGSFLGRLHVAISTVWQSKTSESTELRPMAIGDLSPTINLSLTARSGFLEGRDLKEAFDTAHETVSGEFKSVTTDRARSGWGLS